MSSRSVAALCLALAACSASQPAAPTVTVPAATAPVVAKAAAPTVTVPAATASTPVAKYTYGLSIGTFAGDAPPGKVLEDLVGAVNVKPCMVGLRARGVAKMGTLRVSLTIDRRGNVKAPAVVADPVQDPPFARCVVEALAKVTVTDADAGKGVFEVEVTSPEEIEGSLIGVIK